MNLDSTFAQSKKYQYIGDQLNKLRSWLLEQPYNQTRHLRELSRQFYTYLDVLNPSNLENEIASCDSFCL
jgi:hypothetical protein